MKYAIISDLHANESALRHVLEDAAAIGAERVVCLGDVVGYGPQPVETVALIRRSAAVTLSGNHDDAVSGRQCADDFIDLAGDAVKRHRDALKADDLAWLKSLPYECELEGAIAAHGDFCDPESFNYVDSEDAAARNFETTDAQLMFVGHTHVPELFLTGHSGKVYRMEPQDFVVEAGKRYIVNPGSVGYPRENNGTCFSSYVLYDSEVHTVSFRFLPFAVASVLQRGAAPRRRTALLLGFAALACIALGTAVYFASRNVAPDLAIGRKILTLAPSNSEVRANLKLERKSAPVELKVEFKSAAGDSLGSQTATVKASHARPFKVPNGATSAHFTLLRQQEAAKPVVRTFVPSAL